ncbi:hypothetical protein KC726_01495 [Candidatus Woesebacteria bacterium]|nr:hypothetical protein [Candidatus Woesebacteria bacterium]
MKKITQAIGALIFILLFSQAVYAGGGPVTIKPMSGTKSTPVGNYIPVQVLVIDSNKTAQMDPEEYYNLVKEDRLGEVAGLPNVKVVIRVKNPREGDYCQMPGTEFTNEQGKIVANCYASEPGQVEVYADMEDKSRFIGYYYNFIHFSAAQSTYPTSIPRPTSTAAPVYELPIVTPTTIPYVTSLPTALPTEVDSTGSAQDQQEIQALQDKVAQLEKKIDEQDQKLAMFQDIIDSVQNFLKRIFNF